MLQGSDIVISLKAAQNCIFERHRQLSGLETTVFIPGFWKSNFYTQVSRFLSLGQYIPQKNASKWDRLPYLLHSRIQLRLCILTT